MSGAHLVSRRGRGRLSCILVLGLLAVLLGRPTPGAAQGLDELVARVQANYDRTRSLKARFVQKAYLKSLRKTQRSEGIVYLKKPGKMRWDYQEGSTQKIVSDGKKLWIYVPENKQVIVEELGRSPMGSTPLSFLLGLGRIREQFEVRVPPEGQRDKQGRRLLELIPRQPMANLSRLVLAVEPQESWVAAAVLHDPYGNRTELEFSEQQVDLELRETLFVFRIPKGIEVFEAPRPR